MVDVVCVKWGTAYPDDYVYILKEGVEKNTTVEHRFFCYTDKPIEGVSCIPLTPGHTGWWNKLQIFNNNYYRLDKRKVYLDLDVVVTGNIDWLMNYNGKLMGNNNHGIVNKYEVKVRQQYVDSFMSAIMAWDSDYAQFIWDIFHQQQDQIVPRIRGDGEFMDALFKQNRIKPDLIQSLYPGKLRSYKYECYEAGGLIEGTTLVDFHGEPNPHEASTTTVHPWGVPYAPQEWVADYWKL